MSHNDGERFVYDEPSRRRRIVRSEVVAKSETDHEERQDLSVPRHGTECSGISYSEERAEEENDEYGNDIGKYIDITDNMIHIAEMRKKPVTELQQIADNLGIDSFSAMSRQTLLFAIMKEVVNHNVMIMVEGLVEVMNEGFAFVRSSFFNYVGGADDIYISLSQVKRFALKTGDCIYGEARLAKKNDRCFALFRLVKINGCLVSDIRRRICFDDLVPCYPEERISLDCSIAGTGTNIDYSTRVMDIISPLGKGQRALIVAPPKTGKTVLMQNIAHAISTNHPEIELIVLLIDERPEEVTDMIRSVKGEVVSSTFDEPAARHVQLAELVIEKAKRIVESSTPTNKRHVVILLDSITRLARAYNAVVPSSGKVLTGGVDSNALQRPKRLFGAARNIVDGGSLTIIATALVETGSRMDEVIFEEFKGTGNSEIILDRRMADKRLFPAMDIIKSGTRKEELLLSKERLQKTWILRRILSQMGTVDALEFLLSKITGSKSNDDFFNNMMNQ